MSSIRSESTAKGSTNSGSFAIFIGRECHSNSRINNSFGFFGTNDRIIATLFMHSLTTTSCDNIIRQSVETIRDPAIWLCRNNRGWYSLWGRRGEPATIMCMSLCSNGQNNPSSPNLGCGSASFIFDHRDGLCEIAVRIFLLNMMMKKDGQRHPSSSSPDLGCGSASIVFVHLRSSRWVV